MKLYRVMYGMGPYVIALIQVIVSDLIGWDSIWQKVINWQIQLIGLYLIGLVMDIFIKRKQ